MSVQSLRACLLPALIRHLGDVGGQKTLRSYWRNYFEKTDALIWVVDATDRLRIEDCREELHGLLQEEVGTPVAAPMLPHCGFSLLTHRKASFRGKSVSVCQQDRCLGVHE